MIRCAIYSTRNGRHQFDMELAMSPFPGSSLRPEQAPQDRFYVADHMHQTGAKDGCAVMLYCTLVSRVEVKPHEIAFPAAPAVFVDDEYERHRHIA